MSTLSPFDADRRYVFHPFSNAQRHEQDGASAMIVEGTGSRLRGADGREYLDAMAGLWCVNVGYGRVEIADALRKQAIELPYFHGFSSMATAPPAELAEQIITRFGQGMSKVFYGNSGSDANDSQVKIVRAYNNRRGLPQKKKIIARDRGYHGVTIASASLTGLPAMHAEFDLPIEGVSHVSAPYRLWNALPGEDDAAFVARLAAELDAMIVDEGPETVAAFIAEPVQGAGGVIVPPDGYFAAIQAVLRKHDVLLIADEVISGFGRLGSWFGSHALGIQPDLVTLAKGVTSAYIPLSAVVVSDRVWQVLADGPEGVFQHGYTYSAHPMGAAAALANLQIVEDEGLVARAAEQGEKLRSLLRAAFADHPLVGEIRGMGLMAAVEFVAKRDPARRFDPSVQFAPRVVRAALERGVITRALPAADTISFSPPFVVTDDELAGMVDGARAAFGQVADEYSRAQA